MHVINPPNSGGVELGEAPATNESSTFAKESGALRRRMTRFRRAGMLEHTADLVVHQATTADELAQAYALVHDVFVYQNYIAPQPGGLRIRPFETLPDMATFVAKAGDRVVACMSVVPDTAEFGLPSDKAFAAEINSLRAQGRRLSETTNLAVAPEYRNSGVFFELSRACVAHGFNAGIDDSFISISPGHSTFFQAVLGFDPFGDRRNYGDDKEDYVEGMRLDLRQFENKVQHLDQLLGEEAFLHRWFFEENPHSNSTRWSAQLARSEFLKPALLRDLFIDRSAYLSRCSREILDALKNYWGLENFTSLFTAAELNAAQNAA